MTTHLFLLGGHDLEMLTIRELLQVYAPGRYLDKGLSWGARASDYRAEIENALQLGQTPVLIELPFDKQDAWCDRAKIIEVDHHGERAGADRPTSLHQVIILLQLPPEAWTRQMELVAANDRGYITEMQNIGATMEEIVATRAADRAAQGITEEQEQFAVQAIANAQHVCNDMLTIVELPHNRTAAVTDRLASELGGPGYVNLLIYSPNEVNFYGKGSLIMMLDQKFPGGWYGGSLPTQGFWGRSGPSERIGHVLARYLEAESNNREVT